MIQKAKQIRKETLDLAVKHNEPHIAPALSIVEILVVLYYRILKKEDKFILSKGHGCLSLYAILKDKGFNPKIGGHPDIDIKNGIYCTTGSLGHGLPIAVGMAFAKKFKKEKGYIYVLVGDGECQEGTIWESLNLARKFKLNNLIIIVDNNKLQALDVIVDNLRDKFKSFGCCVSVCSGHDFQGIEDFLCYLNKKDTPKVLIADTIKGKGISFMENKSEWHSRMPNKKELKQAYEELR